MTRFVLAFAAVLAISSPVLAAPQPPTFEDEAKQAAVIFVGKLVEVGDPPTFLSGEMMAIQTLTYEVSKVEKGSEKRTRVPVRYIIVGGARYVEVEKDSMPHVAKALTKIGATYRVLQEQEKDGNRYAIDAKLVP